MSVTLPERIERRKTRVVEPDRVHEHDRSPSRSTVMLRLNRMGTGPGIPTEPVTKNVSGKTSRSGPWGSARGKARGISPV